jgi:acyl-CoA synthetase (NDP forming)
VTSRPAPASAEPPVDVSGRPLRLRAIDWTSLFEPRTVAVVGASETEGTQQRAQWIQVRDRLGGRGATVVPVHPSRPTILGTPAYRSVLDVPFPIDLAIILVRDPLPVLEECVEKGVGTAVVFAAGFSEVGTAEGRRAEERLRELASGPVRVMGPNTNLNIFEPWEEGLPGKKLAIVTQSGHQGRPISQGQVLGIPVLSWATIGNEADLEFADFVGRYVELPDTGAIAGYVEGFHDGRTLMLAADRAVRAGVPIVLIKVGRTDEGRRMAQAHTGHLTGSDAVHQAVFDQFGIVRVDDLDEIIEISGMFCHTTLLPPASRGGVCIYALSGGTASHMVDLCSEAGLSVPRLEERIIEGLRQYIPWFLRCDNPVDSGGTITALPAGRAVLDLLVEDANTDILLVPITGVFPGMSDALARDLIELHAAGRKRVIAIWSSPRRDDPAYDALCRAGVPLFHSFCAAVRGIKALVDFSSLAGSYVSPFDSIPRRLSRAAGPARKLLAGGGVRDEVESKALLGLYGIPTVPEHVATSAREAATAADAFDGAVVMKVLSADIAHKSDLGLVSVGVEGATAARAAYRRIMEEAAARAPEARVEGVVVQPMVRGAVAEAILGLSQQHPFGPTLLFGLGGIFVEVFEDVAIRVPPFSRASARAMVEQTRGFKLLAGARGRPPGDLAALVDAIMRLQRLALEVGDDIDELDINPLMVLPRGEGVVAVDALVVARRSP